MTSGSEDDASAGSYWFRHPEDVRGRHGYADLLPGWEFGDVWLPLGSCSHEVSQTAIWQHLLRHSHVRDGPWQLRLVECYPARNGRPFRRTSSEVLPVDYATCSKLLDKPAIDQLLEHASWNFSPDDRASLTVLVDFLARPEPGRPAVDLTTEDVTRGAVSIYEKGWPEPYVPEWLYDESHPSGP